MTNEAKLLSCPFCGSDKLTDHYYLQQSSDGEAWFVECQDCESQGPCKPSATEAREAWDNRNGFEATERRALLEMTEMLDEHPEGYDGPCSCKLCQSYGD